VKSAIASRGHLTLIPLTAGKRSRHFAQQPTRRGNPLPNPSIDPALPKGAFAGSNVNTTETNPKTNNRADAHNASNIFSPALEGYVAGVWIGPQEKWR